MNTLLNCKLEFYLKYIQKYREKEEVEERIDTATKVAQQEVQENKVKFLAQFAQDFKGSQLANNPRQMKRFVNQYLVARQTRIIEKGGEDKFESYDVKRLLFEMSYPSLNAQLESGALSVEDFMEQDDAKMKSEIKSLTQKQLEGIRKLLTKKEI